MRLNWLVLSAVFAASPSLAQSASAQASYASLSDAQLQDRLNRAAVEGFGNACDDKMPLYADASRRWPGEVKFKIGVVVAQAMCAYEEKRPVDSLRLLKRAQTEYGATGWFISSMIIAMQVNDGAETLAALRGVAANGQLGQVSGDLLGSALNTIRLAGLEPESDEIAYSLATSADFDRIDPKAQSFLARRALSHAAKTRQPGGVDGLLRYVRAPNDVLTLLSLREYEPIWPQVERYAGDNLAPVINNYVSWSAGRLADKPEDLDRLWAYSYALFFAGRYDEAASLADNWLARPGRDGAYVEGDGWALNIKVSALDALGKTAEADKVFDDLAKLSPAEYPWIVNFVINREARLVGTGRWQEGLAANSLARQVAEKYGSPYAKLIVASDRVCAFDRLGRKAESEDELKYVLAHFADSPPSAVEALLCAGRDDEAADLFKRIVADERVRSPLLDGLQDDRFNLYSTEPSQLPDPYKFMAGRPDLKSAASKYVRSIPDRFAPLTHTRRKQVAARAG